MRHYLKSLILSGATFYIVYSLIPTISIGTYPKNVFLIIGGLFIISQIINPVFSLVLLPVNLMTFGLVSLILNGVLIYGLLKFLPDFRIGAYNFPGANIQGIIIPPMNFNQITTIILAAIIITFLQKIFHLIFE